MSSHADKEASIQEGKTGIDFHVHAETMKAVSDSDALDFSFTIRRCGKGFAVFVETRDRDRSILKVVSIPEGCTPKEIKAKMDAAQNYLMKVLNL